MKRHDAIYTKPHECQDCHKCIRECPVKALSVQDGVTRVVPELCIFCGNCVLICPRNAKQVRDDLQEAKDLIRSGRRVIASIAPSYVAMHGAAKPAQLVHALKMLGFAAVSETALGAQQVTAKLRALMRREPGQAWFSSACPVVVEYVSKYRPDCLPYLAPLLSPLLSHCKLLHEHFGEEIAVVSFGPCIAQKKEAERHPELLNVALTFEDLHCWFAEKGIHPAELLTVDTDRFEPCAAQEGTLSSIEGGLLARNAGDLHVLSFSGMSNIASALDGIADWKLDHNLFLEVMACAGSCINGPKSESADSPVRRHYKVLMASSTSEQQPSADLLPGLAIDERYALHPVTSIEATDMQIRDALRSFGQYAEEDELNCGGCGYDSCREFAEALMSGRAERMMCTSYTRKLAQKKANALLQRMPSAVVIVDDQLKIIECNATFMSLFSGHATGTEGFEGSALSGFVPCANLFRRVLESGEDLVGHDIRYERSILNTSIFTIEPHSVIGGIFQDITEPAFQKEQIIERAQAVIQKNLKTAQQIAYLLGENAADSEIILNSIVRSFKPEEVGGGDETPGENQ